MNENELYHFGILKQRWGIRRYQNPDGTLTEAGKERYGKSEKSLRKLRTKVEKVDQKWYYGSNKPSGAPKGKGYKIQEKLEKKSKKEMNKYSKDVLYPKYKKAIKKDLKKGDITSSKRMAAEYNQKLAELMTEKASDEKYAAPSGRTMVFIAKASTYTMGESAIYATFAYRGTEKAVKDNYKHGVREDGRIAYTKQHANMVNYGDDDTEEE